MVDRLPTMTPNETSERLERDTAAMRSAEVAALIAMHSMTFGDACDFVGLDPADFVKVSITPKHMPMPSEIEAMTTAMRSGELIVSRESGNRWRRWRGEQATEELEPVTEADEDAEADEDMLVPMAMPSWFTVAAAI